MPIHAPFYRELNLSRVRTLLQRGYSYATIASVIHDKTGVSMSATQFRHYVDVSELASNKMMVRSKTMQTLDSSGEHLRA